MYMTQLGTNNMNTYKHISGKALTETALAAAAGSYGLDYMAITQK